MMNTPMIDASRVIRRERLPGGRYASFILKRSQAMRLTDLEGGANVTALFFNAREKSERYNMADTLKAQHTAYLTQGHVCYSDMGRILVSIIADTCGWHDTLCGVSDAASVQQRYGEASYQTHRNGFHRNGRELFLIELGKWALDRRDLVANVNFFSKVVADQDGRLTFQEHHSRPGCCVDLRAEMDVLVVLNTCPHVYDPRPEYDPKPVELTLWQADAPGVDDACRIACPENERGFINTALWLQQA